MSLIDFLVVEERIKRFESLLEKHKRNDIKLIAVNRLYDFSWICEDSTGSVRYYTIDEHLFRGEGQALGSFGGNFTVIDDRYACNQTVYLKGKGHTSCATNELDSYLAKGWVIDN
jgi:hypothetical protein